MTPELHAAIHAHNIAVQKAREAYHDDPFAGSRISAYGRITGLLNSSKITRDEADEMLAEVRAW